MNYLEELVQMPKSGHVTRCKYYSNSVKEALGDKSYPSHWVLMTRDIIPGSRDQWYQDCCELIAEHSKKTGLPYELPHLLEVTTSILMHYVKTKERLYSSYQCNYTYSQDIAEKEYRRLLLAFCPQFFTSTSTTTNGVSTVGAGSCQRF